MKSAAINSDERTGEREQAMSKFTEYPAKVRAYAIASTAVENAKLTPYLYRDKKDREEVQKELQKISRNLERSAQTVYRNIQIKKLM